MGDDDEADLVNGIDVETTKLSASSCNAEEICNDGSSELTKISAGRNHRMINRKTSVIRRIRRSEMYMKNKENCLQILQRIRSDAAFEGAVEDMNAQVRLLESKIDRAKQLIKRKAEKAEVAKRNIEVMMAAACFGAFVISVYTAIVLLML